LRALKVKIEDQIPTCLNTNFTKLRGAVMNQPSRKLIYTTRKLNGREYRLEAVVQKQDLYAQLDRLGDEEIEVITIKERGRTYYAVYLIPSGVCGLGDS
jgi:hypothetical protein